MMETAKQEEVYRIAFDLYCRNPDWVTFFREVLGKTGLVRQHFPNSDDRTAFERTEEYAKVQQLLGKLRERAKDDQNSHEPIKVITVRMPESLHEALKHEAHEYHTSMNKLCISKLLQFIETELVPTD
jgi:predicted HicB family RNase H-like nuclease